ncbi:asparagine synthetase B [Chondrinema litorale]|uniref:asparagine synthetase B n=1 Tax=Chondrinema litorale TaxID=2994555 RepID=UPI002543C29D|nr:asparagine synthetase B [Chondrinema litorale]UZR93562.1 asparagine synthetase B [Chondrinema litorale]
MKYILLTKILIFTLSLSVHAQYFFIPMDNEQNNHLKAYGIAYEVLNQDKKVEWLLNYRGGSFLFKYEKDFERLAVKGKIKYDVISKKAVTELRKNIDKEGHSTSIVKLKKAPKIAIYAYTKIPFANAVLLALEYTDIPFDIIYDKEVMAGKLKEYDVLHLHHEDFTGQYGKYYATYGRQEWYKTRQKYFEETAKELNFSKVSQLKLAIAKEIKNYCADGGILFSMCAATDTYDIALATDTVDICDFMYDGDPPDRDAQEKLNFDNTLAFKNFKLKSNPYEYEYSNIDNQSFERGVKEDTDFFNILSYSAKTDKISAILTQNHQKRMKGFMGQTTAFKTKFIKPDVKVLTTSDAKDEARYIYNKYEKGYWIFLGGHDPEDYRHFVGEEATKLSDHPNSPGYRLILNNILLSSALD